MKIKISIRKKIIIPLIVFSLIIVSVTVIVVSKILDNQMLKAFKGKGIKKTAEIELIVDVISSKALVVASVISNFDDVKESYRFDDDSLGRAFLRNKLSDKLRKVSKDMKSSNKLKIHFHKPPAKSFWRAWKKESGGDDISSFRKSVLNVSKTQKSLNGIEVGVTGFVIRGISPIFDNKKYIGSVEAFYSFKDVIKLMKIEENENIIVFIDNKKAQIAPKLKHNTKVGNYTVVLQAKKQNEINNINKELLHKDSLYQEVVGNIGYTVMPIKDINDNNCGKILYSVNLNEKTEDIFKTKLQIIISISVIIILVLIIVIFVINKTIINPVRKSIFDLDAVTKGNLNHRISHHSNDDIGMLATKMNETFEKFMSVIHSTSYINDKIVKSGIYIKDISQIVSQGASEQAASVQELSASMEQMSANIEQNVSNAEKTEKEIYLASAAVYEGNKSVKSTAELMIEMEEHLSIINEITKQTNILALNASVEASEAGNFGKGFAVIAREIRELSENTQQAAIKIKDSISSGINISEKASTQLADIVKQMENSSEMIKLIVVSSKEQKGGVEQVINGIEQLNNVTQKNASVAEDMTANANNTSRLAQELTQKIKYFNVENKSSKTEEDISKTKGNELNKVNSTDKVNKKNRSKELNTDNENSGFTIELQENKDDNFELF